MSGSEFERENLVAETLSATAASKSADALREDPRREHDWRPPAEGQLFRVPSVPDEDQSWILYSPL